MYKVVVLVALCAVAVIAAPAPAESMEEHPPSGEENSLMSVDADLKGDSATAQDRAKRFIFLGFGGWGYPYYPVVYPAGSVQVIQPEATVVQTVPAATVTKVKTKTVAAVATPAVAVTAPFTSVVVG